MQILIVEDDYLQASNMEEALLRNFPESKVRCLRSEYAFIKDLESIRSEPPDMVLMDIMLRWSEPTPDTPPAPEEISRGGFFRAGIRCLTLLLQSSETNRVPVVLYSVLERIDVVEELGPLPDHVLFLRKDADDEILVRHLRSLLAGLGEVPDAMPSWRWRLWNSIEAKPGWLGFGIDLKKLFTRNRAVKDDS